MNSETYIDFCFIRNKTGHFAEEIQQLLKELFKGMRLQWYLDEKVKDDLEIIVAEIKGMSKWQSEQEAIDYIEATAKEDFWMFLQGYQMSIYPQTKGCVSCGTH
ncbi:hypothetical protein [Bacillus sp. FJAT-50079]|uniref:hypothetical protein n=1 Tax=Bacillus sp. FJAT-50079 TaxID=2833577 RepID=UPI001BC9AEE2|nr:hypothetical protein [Bacillus sp. FJAT-50079]MBS4209222.1 hypothetical protein [Bacillus sp. FJAT-50079]